MFSNTRLLIILIPLLPLLGAIVTAILGPRVLKEKSHWPVVLGIVGSFLCSFAMLQNVSSQVAVEGGRTTVGYQQVEHLWTWASIPEAVDSGPEAGTDFTIDVALRTDPLTAIMLVMVTFVASLVAIYGIGYMHGERGYWRFFAYIGLFVFSMTMLVSVSNFLLLFVFWEAVGACSYLLIGFWYEKDSAAAAGKKAFLVNRVGDFGFMLAMFLIWMVYGTWNFHDVDGVMGVLGQQRLSTGDFVAGGTGLAICLLLMLGACGKSAQFPLHVWLADAMEGPTPVSALIHAATMVTAGVYMVTRCTPLFLVSPAAQLTVACIGGITALMAGLIAITQFDLKRVLAYSTLSQLGYMFLGLGTGTLAGITAGMFHLFTHAFFKALLFLGAGSVMHSMGGVIDMRRFGGLRKLMPITHATFLIGCLALAGLFPLSGFWSKDAIVGAVHDQAAAMKSAAQSIEAGAVHAEMSQANGPILLVAAHGEGTEHAGQGNAHSGGQHTVTTAHLKGYSPAVLNRGAKVYSALYYMSLFTAFLTALYTFRAFFLTFYGEEEIPAEAGHHAHESPPTMWVPLVILSVFAAGVGWWLQTTHGFDNLLAQTPSLSTAAAKQTPPPGVFHMHVAVTSSIIAVVGIALASFFYLGNTNEAERLAKLFSWPHKLSYGKFFWDEIYEGLIVKPLQLLAKLSYLFDERVIDGIVNFFGWLPRALAGVFRSLQVGLIPFYGLAMVLGMLTLLAARAPVGERLMAGLLIATVLLPIVGAMVVVLIPSRGPAVPRMAALVVTLVTAALAIMLLRGLVAQPPALGTDFAAVSEAWLPADAGIDIRFALGLDGVSAWMFGLSAILMITSVLVSWEAIQERPALFYAMLLLLEAGCLGVFAARDIILFYVFFEFTLIPLFFLIGIWGSEQRRYAATKFFVYTLAGSLLTFLGLLTIVFWNHQTTGALTFSIRDLTAGLTAHPMTASAQLWVFLALFAGFAIKVPLFPLHTWLPLAHVQAPTAGSVILAGIMLKIGTYGFVRFSIPMLPDATVTLMPWLMWLSVIGIVYGALVALAQTDVKRLIAYSSVSHLGFCTLGLFALNRIGTEGAMLQMVNHGISTGGLFAIVGMMYERYHTREIKRLGGIARQTPWLAFFMLLFTFSSIGLPGLNGFAGEILILLGSFQRGWSAATTIGGGSLKLVSVAAVSGVVLGAWYMLWLVQRVFFGPARSDGHHDVRDLQWREIAALVPLAVLVFWIGLYPKFFLDPVGEPLNQLTQQARSRLVGGAQPGQVAEELQVSLSQPVRVIAKQDETSQ